jgi:AcrR family transcriptional regulator
MSAIEKVVNNETVTRILSSAEELFLERNYADVTVSQVAEAAGLTKGAVYHYFPSKEKLYLAMLHNDLAQKSRLYRQQALEIDGSCAERLRHLTRAFLSLPETKRRLIGLVRRDVNIFPPQLRDELVRAYQQALPDLVEEIIRDGVRDGELMPCDPRLLAWQFVALVEVVLTPYAKQRFACDDDKLNYVLSMFLNGCARERNGDRR